MGKKNEHFRQIILFYFNKGENVAQTRRKICAAYGGNVISDWTVGEWFRRFRRGDFSCIDLPRSGRPIKIHDDHIKDLIENNPSYTTREIAEILKISKSSVTDHLHRLDYVNRCDTWMPNNAKKKGKLLDNPISNKKVEMV